MTKMYDFAEKLAEGEAGEATLDKLWDARWQVLKAGRDDQRRGIDRWLIDSSIDERHSLEYKTDTTAGRTGNAFVETVSVSTTNKPGWAVSSQAQWLIYYIPKPETVYCIKLARLRQALPMWRKQYPSRDVQNRGYVTTGLLGPLDEFEKIAEWVR